ncbi:MAG: ThuA domain-containing protein [Desulfurellaceae bacterium]|nr:ThuA domain-containing protein [Desulfurellaceae bacterium]
MSNPQPVRVHVITGGFPVGSPAGHDMDYARLRLLQLLHERPNATASVSGDFTDIDKWLPGCQLLVTYVAGPFPNEAQNRFLRQWLKDGGRWLGLHGTSGGKAAPVGDDRRIRKMVKADHHTTLGGFFLNHPPLRKFRVDVVNQQHRLTRGLPASFEVMDELYLIELQEPAASDILLTTELAKDPSPPGFGFVYDEDTALQADGKTRVLGFSRALGRGGVAYIALGHCHSTTSNMQPFVDASVDAESTTPQVFRGSWDTQPFEQLLRNGIEWGCDHSA